MGVYNTPFILKNKYHNPYFSSKIILLKIGKSFACLLDLLKLGGYHIDDRRRNRENKINKETNLFNLKPSSPGEGRIIYFTCLVT